ncbi:uncharacterized protein LOC135702733 [Ochlerotatus camptorhynchus]|uniref:uncharacterized protein LOC135702733 n=1 Tax=Ochlerotatus camptorhynchus TaxID=644619 RepID=UPI0031D5776F
MSFLLKHWFNIGNIYQTVQPACRSMKWFGFMPFTMVATGNDKNSGGTTPPTPVTLTVKRTDALLLLGWQIYILSMCNSDWISALSNAPMSKIMIYFTILMYVIEAIFCSTIQLRTALCRSKIDEVLRLVKFTDDMLAKLGIAVNHRRHHLGLVLLISATIVGAILVTVTELTLSFSFHDRISPIWKQLVSTGAMFYYHALRTAQICPLAVFLGAMVAFRSRFRMLNESFRSYFDKNFGHFDDEEVQEHLKLIAIGHDVLTDAVDLFNDIFSIQMVFACFTYVEFSIFSMFSVGALFSGHSTDVLFLSLIYSIAFLFYSLYIIPIIKISADVQNEGKRMAVLVHKAINQSPLSACSIKRLLLFSQQLQQQTPAVSSGMFSFDWTLCFSILSTVATYTMIMVQFELEVPKFFLNALVSSTMERDMGNVTLPMGVASNSNANLDV